MFSKGNELIQTSGRNASNFQAGRDIHFSGMSYGDARQLFLDLFSQQVRSLSAEAAEVASERAKALVHDFLSQFKATGPENLATFADPGFLLTMVAAEQSFAASGDRDLGDVLVNLLAERASKPALKFMDAVFRQAVEIAPLLSSDQWNALSAILALREILPSLTSITEPQHLAEFVKSTVAPLLTLTPRTEREFRNILYTGCATAVPAESLSVLITKKLPWIYSAPVRLFDLLSIDYRAGSLLDNTRHDRPGVYFSREVYVDLTPRAEALCIPFERVLQIKKLVDDTLHTEFDLSQHLTRLIEDFQRLNDTWTNRPISGTALSPVGMVIAQANIRRVLGQTYELDQWLQ